MAFSINMVIVSGNVGSDPEIKQMNSGKGKFVTFPIAVEEFWTNKETGEKNSKTSWFKIISFNPYLVELSERKINKGSKVFIKGKLKKSTWTDENNKSMSSINIEPSDISVLGSKANEGTSEGGNDFESSGNEFEDLPI
ncbi:single-stranded DNA-binding protein [Candidatus Nesciobacter abundans]|nr:single-stranded DNA-binding protein [Candidatus Nesciobacter abundans]